MLRLFQRRTIVIRRDDHIGDTLGAIFLDPSPEKADWTIDLLSAYFGRRVRVLKAELMIDRAEIDVAVQALCEEAGRLVAAARDLKAKGAPRNALELFRRALELDPLNHAAAFEIGIELADQKRLPEAFSMLKRARETGPDTANLLYGLGWVALQLSRTATAAAYFETACELSPEHFPARRALSELGRKVDRSTRPRTSTASASLVLIEGKHR
jgi:tetratricopeptide (TPR) repeat protein